MLNPRARLSRINIQPPMLLPGGEDSRKNHVVPSLNSSKPARRFFFKNKHAHQEVQLCGLKPRGGPIDPAVLFTKEVLTPVYYHPLPPISWNHGFTVNLPAKT